jgi:tRNA 2-thiouridine synthesizing protein A
MEAAMTSPAFPHDAPPASWRWDVVVDGGWTGCGDLLLELRRRFQPLGAGTRVLVIARDEGAPIEMPAWCRLTGHGLEQSDHPHYLIRKKQDPKET